ncbi:TPA: hypothetical protein DCW61_04995 [Candidatus Uhrbacteria bacterium]|nr:hypothetical protein [Candidatus Uhrbacteria bacterium]
MIFLMAIVTLYASGYVSDQVFWFLMGTATAYVVFDLTGGRIIRRWWKTTPTYKNLVSFMTRVLDTKLW